MPEEAEQEEYSVEYEELIDILPMNAPLVTQTWNGLTTQATQFRTGPGTHYESIRNIAQGSAVVILNREQANWWYVRIGNQTGWMDARVVREVILVGITATSAALRQGPGTAYSSMRTLAQGTDLEILGASANGSWIRVRVGNQIGWAHRDRVTQTIRVGVTATSAALRQGPGTAYASMRTLSRGTNLEILGTSLNGSWIRVRVSNQVGWVHRDRVTEATSIFDEIFAYAQRYLGRRHVMGGNSPARGFDCSGFTQWIYGVHGITLSRTTQQQFNSSTRVSRANARPGDLVFFSGTFASSDWITHVGMYVGDGRMIHVSSSRGVTFDNIHTGWWANHFVGYGRVID